MRRVPLFLPALVLAAAPAFGRVIYVDNRTGDDVNDGRSATTVGIQSGPVRSLERAHVLVGPGDVIEIANTGNPYYGSLRLIGARCSGVPSQPVVVNGHGAVIDGSEPADPAAWESLGDDLWRLEPPRKGWYQLVRGDDPVPEVPAPREAARPNPPAGRWAAWRGAIYYRGEPDEVPANEPYRIATREAGIFLYAVRHVLVRDLTVRHFRLDGVNAHDQVYDTAIENVASQSNGRSGFFVGGSSRVAIRGGATRANRGASVLIQELGRADVQEAALDAEPVVE
jgi:hypothetical protein